LKDDRFARRTLLRAGIISMGLAGSTFGVPAIAQEQAASAADVALARNLGLEGVKLADSGDCAGAIDKFQRAETLYHAPTILGRLGECQIAVGKLVAGTESLQRVVREALPPRAPAAFVAAQERAKKLLNTALPKVAKLRIHLDAPPGARAVVRLDGEPVSLATLDVDRPADPGSHAIDASAPGFLTATTQVALRDGEAGAATLKLEPDPAAAGAPPPGYPPPAGGPPGAPYPPMQPGAAPPPGGAWPPPAPQQTADVRPGGSSKTAGFVVLGVGAAGLVVGSVFGLMAKGKASTLDGVCGPTKGQCPSSSQTDIDAMKSQATISTVGFVVGGAGIGGGLILLLTAGSSKPAAATGAVVRPYVGAASAGVTGAF
jgi:hypothetical protein